jgi:hypothetical protein
MRTRPNMPSNQIVVWIFNVIIAACPVSTALGQSGTKVTPNNASGPRLQVHVLKAIPLGTSAYEVHLSYAFKVRQSVWLQGVGTISPVGDINYVVRRNKLVFRSSKNGSRLVSVSIEPTAIQQLPEDSNQFPSVTTGAGVNWKEYGPALQLSIEPATAPRRLFNTFKDNKKNLSLTPCRPDDEGCLLTPWVRITDPGKTIQGQISIMLTFKAVNPKHQTTIVRIFYAERQGFIGSPDWDPAGGKVVKDAGDLFLPNLRSAIANLGSQ